MTTPFVRFILPLLVITAGCSVGPDYSPPKIPVAAEFTEASQRNDSLVSFTTEDPSLRWWTAFGDQKLLEILTIGRSENLDLKVAAARLDEARAIRSEGYLDFFPTVRNENSYSHTQLSSTRFPATTNQRRDSEVYSTGAQASWEMDLWGRVRRSDEANKAEVEAAEADRDFVRLSIDAEIAKTYFTMRGYEEELRVAKRNSDNQSETLRLTEALRDAGEVTDFDTSRSHALLLQTQSLVPQLEHSLQATKFQLATLLGKQPHDIAAILNEGALPSLRTTIAIGNPEKLLMNRPDVRMAERSLAAATARIGVAVADYFPRIVANGSFALEASSPRGFSNSGAETWSFGPSISWAFLDIGRVHAKKNAAAARADAALSQYRRTVLQALQETETALSNVNRSRKSAELLKSAVSANQRAVEISQERYQAGISDFITVLDVQRTALDVETQYTRSATVAMLSVVALYQALGVDAFELSQEQNLNG